VRVVTNDLFEPIAEPAPDDDAPEGSFGYPNDEFIDAFSGCCASLAVLLNTLDALDPQDSVDASSEIVYRLCLVAGTVGYGISGEFTAEP
jgi:hypothetical protein